MSYLKQLPKTRKVKVFYKNIHWGNLTEASPDDIYFEYTEEAISSEIELSPLECKLVRGKHNNFSKDCQFLPGFIYDCLPVSFLKFRMPFYSFSPSELSKHLSALDILTHPGLTEQQKGILKFEKPNNVNDVKIDLPEKFLLNLNKKKQMLQFSDYLGSIRGDNPKMFLYYNPNTNIVANHYMDGLDKWVFNFTGRDGFNSVDIKQIYMECGKAAGLEVADSKYIQIGKYQDCFVVKHSKGSNNENIHFITVGSSINQSSDYDSYLNSVKLLTQDIKEVRKAFTQCIFHIIFDNKYMPIDNVSFIMSEDNTWKHAQCVDLNHQEQHTNKMNIKGKENNISLNDLLDFASRHSISKENAKEIIEKICSVAIDFEKKYSQNKCNVNIDTIKRIVENINQNVLNIYTGDIVAYKKPIKIKRL